VPAESPFLVAEKEFLFGHRWATRALALEEADELKVQYLRKGGALIARSRRPAFHPLCQRSSPLATLPAFISRFVASAVSSANAVRVPPEAGHPNRGHVCRPGVHTVRTRASQRLLGQPAAQTESSRAVSYRVRSLVVMVPG
jgi:hypothetical protein